MGKQVIIKTYSGESQYEEVYAVGYGMELLLEVLSGVCDEVGLECGQLDDKSLWVMEPNGKRAKYQIFSAIEYRNKLMDEGYEVHEILDEILE